MTLELSPNTQAILLLTAPLIAGRGNHRPSVKPLGAGEYRRLARRLRELQHRPADLLTPGARGIVDECRTGVDPERLERLLGRGFLLAQMEEHWRARAIWVLSRADAGYPRRLKQRLGEDAPPVLYGCGNAGILSTGGLAVVGSRNVHETVIEYTENMGKLVAAAGRGLVSGGARGVDQAAMRGALDSGGRVVGVLADSLERAAMLREHREALMGGCLVLACPYDPAARFQVGHAMQRNKLIYALSDAALVVNSDHGKGGTWTGATEQLDKLKLVPVYVRANGGMGSGLEALRERGAMPWPDPGTPEALERILDTLPGTEYDRTSTDASDPNPKPDGTPVQRTLSVGVQEESVPSEDDRQRKTASLTGTLTPCAVADSSLAGELFVKVGELIERMDRSKRTEVIVADELQVSRKQAKVWLERFAEEKIRKMFKDTNLCKTETEIADILQIPNNHVRNCLKILVNNEIIDKLFRPVRYCSKDPNCTLFNQ